MPIFIKYLIYSALSVTKSDVIRLRGAQHDEKLSGCAGGT
jgi:hypothetical protein